MLLKKVLEYVSNLFNADVELNWYDLADMYKYNETQL